jgi:hypothetical protein
VNIYGKNLHKSYTVRLSAEFWRISKIVGEGSASSGVRMLLASENRRQLMRPLAYQTGKGHNGLSRSNEIAGNVRLSQRCAEIAKDIGNGVINRGIRIALENMTRLD